MSIVLGALIGYLCGWAVWLTARHFAPIYQTAAGAPGTTSRLTTTSVAWIGPILATPVHLLMTGWGAYVGWRGSSPLDMFLIVAITAVLLAITLIDLRSHRIPNVLTLTLLGAAALQILLLGQPGLLAAATGLLLGGGILLVVAILGRGALGMGDVKLAAASGALLGFPAALPGLFLGILLGGLAAMLLLVSKRAGRKDPFAYGPYLALGAWIVLVQTWGLWPI